MKRSRILLIALISFLFCSWLTLLAAYGQDEEEIELLPPNYANAQFGFGLVLPEGYITFEYEEGDAWVLQMIGEMDQAGARVSAEPLPEGITDVAGYWQLIKERDPLMAKNITYEMVDAIAGTGAVLSRVEQLEGDKYILAITWAFVHGEYGFTLSAYPPEMGDYNQTRDLALEIAQQFRWMTEEEIQEFEGSEAVDQVPGGQEF